MSTVGATTRGRGIPGGRGSGSGGGGGRRRPPAPDGSAQHREWLSLIEVSGPFLSLPVLRRVWPTLDPLEKKTRERLRREHTAWLDDPVGGQAAWVRFVLGELLGWGNTLVLPDGTNGANGAGGAGGANGALRSFTV
ncbi:hypothetical protein UK99_08630, partial [Frankia casuarinae]